MCIHTAKATRNGINEIKMGKIKICHVVLSLPRAHYETSEASSSSSSQANVHCNTFSIRTLSDEARNFLALSPCLCYCSALLYDINFQCMYMLSLIYTISSLLFPPSSSHSVKKRFRSSVIVYFYAIRNNKSCYSGPNEPSPSEGRTLRPVRITFSA